MFMTSSHRFTDLYAKVHDQPDVKDTPKKLHTDYVFVPPVKTANNVIVVCMKYCIDTLTEEMGVDNRNGINSTYAVTILKRSN